MTRCMVCGCIPRIQYTHVTPTGEYLTTYFSLYCLSQHTCAFGRFSVSDNYQNPRACWRQVLQDACLTGPPRRRTSVELKIAQSCSEIRLADAGFHPNRWVTFCDHYLAGGPEFEAFLRSGDDQYQFHNWGGHRRGGCLTHLNLSTRLMLSRASNWVPTGILDLKLLNMVMVRTGLRDFTWRIEDLCLDAFTASASVDFPADGQSDWFRRARSVVDGTAGVKLLGKHEKALKRHKSPLSTDESEIANSFIHFVPEDVAFLAKTSGRQVRNYLRASSGRLRGAGYAWASASNPEASALLTHFGLAGLDIPTVARHRALRNRK